jgi:predicted sugar kinase
LYRYGHLAGECFSACQGGPFNGPGLAELVAHIHNLGFEGVGQSSWGPTLFVVAPDQQAAEDLAARLRDRSVAEPLEVLVAAPNNRGARLEGAAPRPPVPELAEPALSP